MAETLEAIRQAHRDTMPAECWAAISDTQDALFRATWAARPRAETVAISLRA